MNIPYTYLIGWKVENKWYYGVRYAKNCNPTDLWKTYFTSSKYVKEFRESFGEPDVIEIRKTFNSSESALTWEHCVLKRLSVVSDPKWINKTDNISFDPIILRECKLGNKNPMYGKLGKQHPAYGRHHTEETKAIISDKSTGSNNSMYGKCHKQITCPHCNTSGPANMMKRWHFDKCKRHPNYVAIPKPAPKSKYIRTKYIYIFLNLKTGEYLYTPMVEFAKKYALNYSVVKTYFGRGRTYKDWIRL